MTELNKPTRRRAAPIDDEDVAERWPKSIMSATDLREFVFYIAGRIDWVQAVLRRGNVEEACDRLSVVKEEVLGALDDEY